MFTLTRKAGPADDTVERLVWPIEISCTAGEPREIFVYTRGFAEQASLGDRFSCVASPRQIRTLPVDNPTTDESGLMVPFFRKSVLRLDCRDAAHAEYIWGEVLQQVRDLVDNINAAADLLDQETITITIT